MSKMLIFALVSVVMLTSACNGSNAPTAPESEQPKKVVFLVAEIGISQFLKELFIVQPVLRALIAHDYVAGKNLEYTLVLTEERSMSDAEASTHFSDAGVIITIGDAALEITLAHDLDCPVVFVAEDRNLTDEIHETIAHEDSTHTGIVSQSFYGKRLEFLLKIDPTIQRVLVLYNPELMGTNERLDALDSVAEFYGATLVLAPYSDTASVFENFNRYADDVDAVFIENDETSVQNLNDLAEQALYKQLPLVTSTTAVLPDVLMSYGADLETANKTTARVVSQLLNGKSIKDLPIEYVQPKLVVSLIAAEALGIDIPNSILRQADVILRPNTAADDN